MKKLLALLLTFALVLSCAGISYISSADEAADNITDTSGFNLTSIELTEEMLVGYNIGNSFEMTELRSNYNRPDNITDFSTYKETLAGNVVITEDYIKYLKSLGIQAIRLPVTWFNALEMDGELVSKNTFYAGLETRRNFWYNGTINAEFMDRVQQVVDWIIGNGMYCILNSHHDGACNNANAVNPVRFGATYNEQAIKFLTNIWTQIGEKFKDYGSKLLFEPYNEVADESGSMTPSTARDNYAAEVLTSYIQLIRAQGGNNAERFIVCPRYGGVSLWTSINGFKDADTASDKLIITTHTYLGSGSVQGSLRGVREQMTKLGVGAIVDEIGGGGISSISTEAINIARNIRTYSDEYKVSCFWWDNGAGDYCITNRYYNLPATDALGAYVGKALTYKTYTQAEAIALTSASQPNWIELYSADSDSTWGGKYMLICSEKQITTLDKSTGSVGQGFYTFSGADNGLLTYFTSDDGENYKLMHTVIQTDWAKVAWNMFKIYGSTYFTVQSDGNYNLQKIGDGLQNYTETGSNLIAEGGNWKHGQYSINNGSYEGEGSSYYNARICLENKLSVTPDEYYMFSLVEGSSTRYQFILRGYDANGNFIKNMGTITNGAMQIPSNISQISIALYDSQSSASTIADTLLGFLSDGTFKPTIYHYVDKGTNPSPTVTVTTAATSSTITATTPTDTTPTASGATTPSSSSTSTEITANEAVVVETGTEYATLKQAITAATAGQTVKLLDDVTTPLGDGGTYVSIASSKSGLVIDFDGHTVYNQQAVFASVNSGSATAYNTVTFKNGKVIQAADARSTMPFDFNKLFHLSDNVDITFDGMTVSSGNYLNSYGYSGMITGDDSALNINVTFKNTSVLDEADFAVTHADYSSKTSTNQCLGFNYAGTNINVTLDNATLLSQYAEPLNNLSSAVFNIKSAHITKVQSNLGGANYTKATVAEGYYVTNTAKGDPIAELLDENRLMVPSVVSTYNELYFLDETAMLAVDVSMRSGAAMRLNNVSGIRFYTNVDTAKIAKLRAEGATVEMGTLIAPIDLLNGEELTLDTPVANYVDVVYDSTKAFYTENDFTGIVGSLAEIKTANANRKFVGRGYVKVTKDGKTYVSYASYADNDIANNSRAIAWIATQVKADAEYDTLTTSQKAIVDRYSDLYIA